MLTSGNVITICKVLFFELTHIYDLVIISMTYPFFRLYMKPQRISYRATAWKTLVVFLPIRIDYLSLLIHKNFKGSLH